MKVLSLTEPYATLIKEKKKWIETRSWKTAYRGELYIHASSTKIQKNWKDNTELFTLIENNPLNFGNIICKCNLVKCVKMTKEYVENIEKNNYQVKVIDYQDGEEAGIKSVTLHIQGDYAYGYLRCENGVHRLVRISPFDSNRRRHTSFASVTVTPEFDTSINIDIKDEDLKIDVYHSSGAGGQSVNTSNSAVRITHLPTKTVVTCQTERSQLRNKEIAMELLKNKLYQKELAEQEKMKKEVTGDASSIDFGSQIRSYILEPYKLVKDHRSKYESTDPEKVLDGDIMPFIKSVLKM